MDNTPGYPPVPPGPRIGEWLSESFTLFGREWQTWLGQGAILLFLGMGPLLVGLAAYYGAIAALIVSGSRTGPSSTPSLGALFAGIGALGVGGLISTFLMVFLMCGMKRTAARQLRGEPIAVRDIFSGGDVFLPVLGASLLIGLAASAGIVFCILPGFLIAGMLSLSLPILVEERLGVLDALRKSWEVTRPNLWMFTLWYFLISLIGGLGTYACYIGLIATLPIYSIGLMVAYRDTVGLPGALPPAAAVPVVPPAPVVDYGAGGPPVLSARCPACGRPVAAGAVLCPHCDASIPPGAAV